MHITIYQTASRLYCVRHARNAATGAEEWRVLKLDRTTVELEAAEDPTPYSLPQIKRLLAAVHAGNAAHGGLQTVCEAHAIVGCVRFLEGSYLLLVTRRRYLGALCGHKVYGIEATALLPVLSSSAHRAHFGGQLAATAEVRYRKVLAGVQLTRDFFFSYTWPVHQTVQRTCGQSPEEWGSAGMGDAGNDSSGTGNSGEGAFGSHRVWNGHLSRPLRAALGAAGTARWVVPLAHGYFEQRPLALLGRTLQLTLIARRSRQFAGTRYLKRGVTDQGFCANDVEVEQVVEAGVDWKTGQPLLSSVVQVRGSIPLHWAQRPDSSVLKPEIVLHRFDPLFADTRCHFDMLREQYGEPVCVLDLVKRVERRPRESTLGCEYASAVRYLNQRLAPGQQRVQYQAFDLSHKAKAAKSHLLSDLQRLQEPVLQATGIFCTGAAACSSTSSSGSGRGTAGSSFGRGAGAAGGGAGSSVVARAATAGASPVAARQQNGVLRTNCIDSLDRTNVAQFTYGMLALGQQLHAMCIAESAWLDPASSLARHLMAMWEQLGHTLALQYGGSEAHATFFQRQRGDWEAATQSRDLLTSVRRFVSNAYTDADKQDAINLFLGNFVPQPGRPHLWELGGDAYLHSGRAWGATLGRAPARSTSTGGAAASAFAAATAAAAGQDLASFPTPVSPQPPAGLQGRLASPPNERVQGEDEEAPPALGESLSTASLVSLSSDGSFAPSLSALVEGASPSMRQRLLSIAAAAQEAAAPGSGGASHEEEPTTPPAPPAVPVPAPGAGVKLASGSGSGSSSPPGLRPRAAIRRSPLLSTSHKAAKLESFDKMLSRQPVAHVRLTATPAAPSKSALGWLSPSKPGKQGGGSSSKAALAPAAAAAAAAAAATVAAAGVAEAPAGVPIPANGLRRSNSDPSLASSQGPSPLGTQPEATAGGALGRRVTFEGAALLAALPTSSSAAAARLHRRSTGGSGSDLQRTSTAPTASLEELATAAAAAAAGGNTPFSSSAFGGQLVLVESSPDEQLTWTGSSLLGAMRRSSSASYHSLAGLNLEGAVEAEAGGWGQGPSRAASDAAGALKPSRRGISFPNFARLRSLGARKSSLDGTTSSSAPRTSGLLSSSASACTEADAALATTPSLLQPSLSAGGGAPEPLSMSAVVFGAEAVRRGVDTLGMTAAAPAWWLTGADPLAAMMEEQQRLHAQVMRQREALATPLDPVEQRALLEQCASLMRPSWALNLSSFAQQQGTPAAGAHPAAPPTPSLGPAPAAHPVAQHGLAF